MAGCCFSGDGTEGDGARKGVLLIEDDPYMLHFWHGALAGWPQAERLNILSALTLVSAERFFNRFVDSLAVIAIDACLNKRNEIDTVELVGYIRARYAGPIVAMSSNHGFRQDLMAAGCDHECEKSVLPQKIIGLLGLA